MSRLLTVSKYNKPYNNVDEYYDTDNYHHLDMGNSVCRDTCAVNCHCESFTNVIIIYSYTC